MAAGKLSEQTTGTTVKIKENGVAKDYIVLSHTYPKSGYTLLMQNYCQDIIDYITEEPVGFSQKDADAFNELVFRKITFEDDIQNNMEIVQVTTFSSGVKNIANTKIFILSFIEVGGDPDYIGDSRVESYDGTRIPYFNFGTSSDANAKRITNEENTDTPQSWMLRTRWYESGSGNQEAAVTKTGKFSKGGSNYTRICFCLPGDMYVAADSSVVINSAPSVPSSINVPAIKGGEAATISWGTSTDPDGNLSGYILERKLDSASFTQVYRGPNRSVSDTVPKGTGKVQYRVKAYDSYNVQSGYRTSSEVTVINNTPPAISGSNGNLGSFGETAPTYQYTVTDADGGTVSVTEKLDNTVLRTYNVTLGSQNTLTIPAATWRNVLNGSHTLTITATDPDGASSTRTQTFTKSVTSLSFTLAAPMAADAMPDRCVVNIQGSFPAGSTLKVEICNNANDASPTWEDITTQAQTGQKYFFTNKTKTAAQWGVNLRVSLSRGGASGACYVSSIGGNFE